MGVNAEHGRMVSAVPSVAIIGAGPAGLMAAEVLARSGASVTVFERMPSPARKLLMAGRGGLNLTHGEDFATFVSRYSDAAPQLLRALADFPPAHLIAWANALGQETFEGTSGRIFPRAMKASPLVRAWLTRLATLDVSLRLNTRWLGWSADGTLRFATTDGDVSVSPDAAVFAVGGASWPRLGADGSALATLANRGIAIRPLHPSNAAARVAWSSHMAKHEGAALKRIGMTVDSTSRRGEAIVTRDGLEGGVVYALGAALRSRLATGDAAVVTIDLKPDDSADALAHKLDVPRDKQSASTFLRKRLGLSPAAIALLHEGAAGRLPSSPAAVAALIKAVPVTIAGIAAIERAISTAGGVDFADLTDTFMLRASPGCFVAGEMLDWDAPTGGYLLQACFATAVAAACGAADFLGLTAVREHEAGGVRMPGTKSS